MAERRVSPLPRISMARMLRRHKASKVKAPSLAADTTTPLSATTLATPPRPLSTPSPALSAPISPPVLPPSPVAADLAAATSSMASLAPAHGAPKKRAAWRAPFRKCLAACRAPFARRSAKETEAPLPAASLQ
ncbi:hypothetical protein THASP1DRAFT_26632, partial [Thamnocephalis sphaerospora]